MGAGALAPAGVCTEFPKDKEFRAFEMLEKIGFSLKPGRCELAELALDNAEKTIGPLQMRFYHMKVLADNKGVQPLPAAYHNWSRGLRGNQERGDLHRFR
jgi:hypothetical protein